MTVCLLSRAQNKLIKAYYILNTLLNKLVKSRGLYVSLVPFFAFSWILTPTWSIKMHQKNLTKMQPS